MYNQKTFIIAELSANHGNKIDVALETIRAAKEAGADAVKIQTYTADTITLDCDNPYFQIQQGTIWDGTTLYQLYQKAAMPWDWHPVLRDEAERLGLVFFSTPFDPTAVDYLEQMGNPIYKIASFEINDIPLIEYAASKGKPMLISTGVATIQEINDAVEACYRMNNQNVTLLKCTSAYPAKIEDANLQTIRDMRSRFGVQVGLSDHTIGSIVAIGAVALGACVVEKHFILDRAIGGPDSSFSMNPSEFKEMVHLIRQLEMSLGRVQYLDDSKQLASCHFKRSLFVAEDIKAGDAFSIQNVRSVRPNVGLAPVEMNNIIGKKACVDISKGTPLQYHLIQDSYH